MMASGYSHCIIIIDPQVDFVSEDGAYAKRHPEIKNIINAKNNIRQLLKEKPEQTYIIAYADYTRDQFGTNLDLCIPGTDGHKIDIIIPDDITKISKTQHSAFSNPSFITHLQQQGFNHLYLTGFLAEYCVRQTALDALKNGFRVSLLMDCIATGDDVMHRLQEVADELETAGIEITNSKEI